MATRPGLNLTNAVVGGIAALLGIGVMAILPGQVGATGFGAALDLRAAGFFPFVAGALILAAGLASLFQVREPATDEDTAWQPSRPALAAAVCAAFVAAVPFLGTFVAMLPMMLCLSVLFRHADLRGAAIVALLVPLCIYLLFERVLLILFPHGWLF